MKSNGCADVRALWGNEKSQYEAFGRAVKIAIDDLLKKNGICANVSYRIKDTDSLIKKIERKKTSYDAIHDKVGVRIVTYFKEQLSAVDKLLENDFTFLIAKREDMAAKLGDSIFGYQSIHYDLSKFENGREIYCELQLRTACQNNWSELSHELAYKTEIALPQELRREINALSAVFELADNQFQLIQEMINKLPDTNPVRILNYLDKFFYTNIGYSYDKELSKYFIENIQDLYPSENPLNILDNFIEDYKSLIIQKASENGDNIFFSQPEIVIIFERLQNSKMNLIVHWQKIYPIDELEEIANIWGTSIC